MDAKKLKQLIIDKKIEPPCFVFDEDILCDRIKALQARLPENAELCYAIKANPFLIRPMDQIMGKYEVCSPGELEICQKYHVAPEKIVFSGVNKRKEEIAEALRYGVGVVTLESMQQYRYVKELAVQSGEKVRVIPRLTSGAQFGINAEEIEQIVCECLDSPFITVAGVHYFTGTQKKKMEKILEEAQFLLSFVGDLEKRFNTHLEILEFGAGLAVPYFEGDDFEGEFEAFRSLANFVGTSGKAYRWTLELGRYLAASCGYYVTQVVDTKCNQGKYFCLVDGGIHHVNYYGQNMAMRVPEILHVKNGNAEPGGLKQEWTVCGSLCTFADILVRKKAFVDLREGDWLVFKNIGAYAVTEAIYLLLSRKMPAIYLYENKNGVKEIRGRIDTSEINS